MTKISEQVDHLSYAAIDLGSNSFHMVIARYEHGELRVMDRIKEMVRLAAGLEKSGALSQEASSRALNCLERFAERLSHIPSDQIRIVGTNTLRKIRDKGRFLKQAEHAIDHPIEIISGQEEARLIFLGISRTLPVDKTRHLLIDIGGGSTEFIIGSNSQPESLESLEFGCVSITRRFFEDGSISRKRFKQAITYISVILLEYQHVFRSDHWQNAIGSSGTFKALSKMARENGLSDGYIDNEILKKLTHQILSFKSINDIDIAGLSNDRAPVMIGGMAIIAAAFEILKIPNLSVSEFALREGVLYDLLGRGHLQSPRARSVSSLALRYHVDEDHATQVAETAQKLAKQLQKTWNIDESLIRLLSWAAHLHEIGLAVSHDNHQKHGAYLARYSDMPGFSQIEQLDLSLLIRMHRGKLDQSIIEDLSDLEKCKLTHLSFILRLAVLLHRNRTAPNYEIYLSSPHPNKVKLEFDSEFAKQYPLTLAGIEREVKQMLKLGLDLVSDGF